jgi:uncharacterized protein (TIGR02001 family)
MKKTLVALSLAAMAIPALAQQKAPEPDYTISGNFALTSDYRFRGVSQSNLKPAVQGGIDFEHKSGFYVGNWNSSVSEWTAPNGGGIEMDFYGGFKTELGGVGIDLGTIYYYYPGARVDAVDSKNYWNTQEIYIGVGYGPLSFKTSYTITDRYFGLGKSNPGAPSTFTGDAKGTIYYDLGFEHEIAKGLTLSAHAGYLSLDGAASYNIKDYNVGLGYDLGSDWSLGLTFYKTSLDKNAKDDEFFVDALASGKKLYKNGAALTLSKSF